MFSMKKFIFKAISVLLFAVILGISMSATALADEPNLPNIAIHPDRWMAETEDWEIYETDGIRIRYPNDWQVVETNQRSIETGVEVATSNKRMQFSVSPQPQTNRQSDALPTIIKEYLEKGYFVDEVSVKGLPAWEITPTVLENGLCKEVVVRIPESVVRFQYRLQSDARESLACHSNRNFDLMISSLQIKVGEMIEETESIIESDDDMPAINPRSIGYNRQKAYKYAADWWGKWSNVDGRYYNVSAGQYQSGQTPADGAHFIAHVLAAGGFPIHGNAGQGHGDPIIFRMSTQYDYVVGHPDANRTTRGNMNIGDVIYLYDSSMGRRCWGSSVIRMSGDVPYVAVHSVRWGGVWRAGKWDIRYDVFYCNSKSTTSYQFVHIDSTDDYSTVIGKIIDQDGDPIPGVVVDIGNGQTGVTDENGQYIIPNVPNGNYVIEVISPGTDDVLSQHPVAVGGNTTVPPIVEQTYSIRGRIYDVRKITLLGHAMLITTPVTDVISVETSSRKSLTNNGYYTLGKFLPGVYEVKPNPLIPDENFYIGCWYKPKSQTVQIKDDDVSGKDFLRICMKRTPIVYVHGWQGLMPKVDIDISNFDFSICSNLDGEDVDGGFGELHDALTGPNQNSPYYPAEYALLETSFCHTPPIQENVPNLENAISNAIANNRALDGTEHEKVILVAHSMGGVVSRAYIEGDDYRGDVKELFTFGTPHNGAPVEDIRKKVEHLINYHNLTVSDLCEMWLGNNFGCDIIGFLTPDWIMEEILRKIVDEYEKRQEVGDDLSVVGMNDFNKHHHPNKNINYHAISGNGSSTNLLGDALSALMDEKPNDGFISLNSGLGRGLTEPFTDTREVDEVHVDLLGIGYFKNLYITYMACVKPVLSGNKNCDGTDKQSRQSVSVLKYTENIPVKLGGLFPGKIVTRSVGIEGGQTMFVTVWQTGTINFELIAPDGQIIDSTYASNSSEVTYAVEQNIAMFEFSDATQGVWQMRIQATDVPTGGVIYSTYAVFDSDLSLEGDTERPWYKPGETATITASISTAPPTATLTTTISYADDTTEVVQLLPQGNGEYQGTFTVPNKLGFAKVKIYATGTMTNGLPFERRTLFLFKISPDGLSLNGDYQDTPVSYAPDPTYYEALSVTVGVESVFSGTIGLSGNLVDAEGNIVAHSNTTVDILAGAHYLTLRFKGEDIYDSHKNGPYTLTNVFLTDERITILPVEEAKNVHITDSYDWKSFGPPNSGITLVQEARIIHTFMYTGDLGYVEMPSGHIEQFNQLTAGTYEIRQMAESMPSIYHAMVSVQCFDSLGDIVPVKLDRDNYRMSVYLDHEQYLICSVSNERAGSTDDNLSEESKDTNIFLPVIMKK
ncbi:carboxypeptidase regulatory-like domain-containing protein [Anaerolineales bacterium HSG6]|nr:carboxypeptidase regulatory-like domain-containing protein [Anaerolineales bacterium HSG6]